MWKRLRLLWRALWYRDALVEVCESLTATFNAPFLWLLDCCTEHPALIYTLLLIEVSALVAIVIMAMMGRLP